MNQCKYCGKEIPEGRNRKFCNHSCSAAYNNTHRTRKPWTEEQKKAFSRKQIVANGHDPDIKKHCKICGKPIAVGKCCSLECRKIARNLSMLQNHFKFDRKVLGTNKVFKEIERITQEIEKLYWGQEMSSFELAKHYGYRTANVMTYEILPRFGIKARTESEGLKLGIKKGTVKIPKGGTGKGRFHTSWEGKIFWLRSSYEENYASFLDSENIAYEVESVRVEYFDTLQQKQRLAIPDFYLPKTNEIVEIKSSWTYDEQNMKDKFKAYRALGYIPKLILDKKEILWE